MKNTTIIGFITLALIFVSVLHLHQGSLHFRFSAIYNALFNFNESRSVDIIFREIRIPRTIISIIAGSSLSIAGLILQTYFNNPLAGPSVLGITSGSSLFVAISVLSGFSFFQEDLGIIFSAFTGALVFSIIILSFSIFVKNKVSLLLIGMMLGSFSSAIIQLFQLSSSATELKIFTLWGFGSLQQVSFQQLPLLITVFVVALALLVFLIKPLNILVLGEHQAQILGLNTKQISYLIIIISAIFSSLITAYCGPIAFIGLAVPNIAKQLFKTQNHLKLFSYTAILGAFVLLFCDLVIMWTEQFILIPLNAITSLIGAPFVIWIILKRF